MKRLLTIFCAALVCLAQLLYLTPARAEAPGLDVPAPCALLMERDTGRVLYEKDAHKRLPPASVTKVMTALLVFEALDAGTIKLEDTVIVSRAASKMGGSQIYLAEGESISVHELVKAVIVVSANDASVALAEQICGGEQAFVARMNERAKQLGMADTTFKNCTGLDEEGHLTSVYDIALMSRALIKHKSLREYTTIWMDSVRGGLFQLVNTNKLIRFYKGATGLKTGSTSIAKYCLSATAWSLSPPCSPRPRPTTASRPRVYSLTTGSPATR